MDVSRRDLLKFCHEWGNARVHTHTVSQKNLLTGYFPTVDSLIGVIVDAHYRTIQRDSGEQSFAP
jgi:hypothetical protein